MSVHVIYKQNGVKMMRPVLTREEYLELRNVGFQVENVARIRQGDEALKASLVQMNYSCLPNDDGTLKGSKRMSSTVGMDIDHLTAEEMPKVKECILQKKDELGLLMLEESARGGGYHLVFKRRPELSQEENLKWASDLLGVEFDKGAKDITRVFFTTTEKELGYLDDEIFNPSPDLSNPSPDLPRGGGEGGGQKVSPWGDLEGVTHDADAKYNGILFTSIIKKYWELFNDGKEPVEGDRNALTFELAVTIRSICGYSLEKMMAVIPNYWKAETEEYRKTLENALKEPKKGMPYRLKQVLQALKSQAGVKACGGTTTTPPPMPKKLPPLLKLLTKNVPWFYKPAVANAVFPQSVRALSKSLSSSSWMTSSSATSLTASVRQNGSRRTREPSRRKTRARRISASRC